LPSLQRYHGIIFDFNGVLLWDKHLNDRAWQETAPQIMGRQFTEAEMHEWVYGRPNRETFEWMRGQKLPKDEALQLIEVKEGIYRGLCLQDECFKLSPGAVALLDALAANGIPHTIATSSEKTNVDFFVEQLNLARWFEPAKIVYDDFSFPGKPAPEIYLKAAAILDLPPRDCVVVEDSLSGLESAHRAGIGKIIALGPEENHAQLRLKQGVDEVVTSLAEIELSCFI